jgi:hypothetical protein
MVYRDIAGETILVPIRRSLADLDSIYTLNETAARVWQLLDGQRPLQAVRDLIADEYEVKPSQVETDLAELVEDLVSLGAIRAV